MSEQRATPRTSAPPARVEHRIAVPVSVPMVALLGPRDEVLRAVERGFPDVDIHVRGNEISFAGPAGDVALAARLMDELAETVAAGASIGPEVVERSITMLTAVTQVRPADVLTLDVLSWRGRTIRPKTAGQKEYVDAIDDHTLTFGIGPAGTGKTYLALAVAVSELLSKKVNRIILTRPAVEAGEKIGFLPGTMLEKVDPYLRPLFDALYDMVEPDQLTTLMEKGAIEVAPLAFMRGRTLNDSFIILDEAQNTSPEQMKMFLTRLGFGSRMVVTGDITQVDLPDIRFSGLATVVDILGKISDIAFINFESKDVVRHKLVQKIVAAYKEYSGLKH
jgi:phosphate starvation-inducible PhoH-like protein